MCSEARLLPERAFFADLGPHACVVEDVDRSWDLEAILAPELTAQFEAVPTGLVDFGFGASRYWVRTKLHNPGDTAGTWWITHDIPIADLVRVRLVHENGQVETLLELTANEPFGARSIPHRHLVSAISLESGEHAELVIDYTTGLGTQMPLFAESIDRFVDRTQTEMANHLLLIAVLLGMGIISTIYFYSLEGPPGLIYGAYVLSATGFLVNAESYGFQLIYPNATEFYRHAYPLLGLLTLAFGTWFISRLTHTRDVSAALYWSVVASVAMLLALVVSAPVFLSYAGYKLGSLAVPIFASAVQVAVIISALKRRQSGAWLLLIAFVVTGIAIAITAAGYMTKGLFPQELAGSAMRLAFFLEGVAYSGAIALRIREARRARDRSLRDQLRLTQESLRLSEAVQKAESDRQDAEHDAHRSRLALSNAAHDIRQPLTSIQMLLADRKDTSADISGSLNYIEDIVSKGLSLAPLGSGSADPVEAGEMEDFELALVLGNVEMMFASDAANQGVDLRVIPSSRKVIADPLSLMRTISNLVSNALKHAEASRILVGVRRCADGVAVEVHDDGKGVSADLLDRLSERGAKGDQSDGFGLGLAIAQELSDQQGMNFKLTSVPGKGTKGRIFIPNFIETS